MTTTAKHTTADTVTEGMVSKNVHARSQTSQLIKMKEALEQGTSYCLVLLTETRSCSCFTSLRAHNKNLKHFFRLFFASEFTPNAYGEGEAHRVTRQ